MTGIGGFLGLEQGSAGPELHAGGLGLAAGRVCLGVVLDHLRPRRILVPFYTGPSILEPIRARGIEMEWLEIGPDLLPRLPATLPPDTLAMIVNYFGLLDAEVDALASRYGRPLVVDDSQAFFHAPPPGAWAFNSARKFFGVPDGGYLFGPEPVAAPEERNTSFITEHLQARLCGAPDALELHRRNEELLRSASGRMSRFSQELLGRVNYEAVRSRRRANYAVLHQRLGKTNRLRLGAAPAGVPLCYPYLPPVAIEHEHLHARGIFVPRYWEELLRDPEPGFTRERDFAAHLLPLPLDQRYDRTDMETVIATLSRHT